MSKELEALDAITDKVLAYQPADKERGMKSLLKIHQQGTDLMADSRAVAKVFGIEHKNLRELIEKNASQLGQLGVYRFQTAKPQAGTPGGRPEKFTYLNFDQIAFLLTLSRPKEENKQFRLRLIIAFRDARNKLRPIDTALLSMPDEWRRAFPSEFYEALLRLYGAEFAGMGDTPSWVGRWTNKFIYEPLYNGLPDELKRRRKLHVGDEGSEAWLKLHQFIEKHAKKNLERHITKVTALLQAATSKTSFFELFTAVFYGQKQLLLGQSNAPDEFA
jgi:phage regulator Rha-like protein